MRKRAVPRSVRNAGNVAERASCSCTRSLTASTVNQMYSRMDTRLSDFPRAYTIAQGYQHYRITNIKLRIKSPYDTYVNYGTGAGAYQKPYLYYMIDKSASIPTNVQLEGLKQMGAKPRVMDEKQILVSWRPSVLQFGATNIGGGIGLPNKYVLSPWLSTGQSPLSATWAPSQVSHLGIYWGAFSALNGVAEPITYEVELEVQFEFKKPLVHTSIGVTSATPAQLAEINSSVDGVVGGPDGV